MAVRPFAPADRDAVVRLWMDCGLVQPQNDPHRDIDRKRSLQPDWFLVGELAGAVVATCMAGYEGHRGWVNYLAVSPMLRGRGLGRQMMAAAESCLREAGCPKINLQVRERNSAVIGFYRALGYAVDPVVSLGKRLASDS